MNATSKRSSETDEARERRSRRIQAFLSRWARRHMPVRVTRFKRR